MGEMIWKTIPVPFETWWANYAKDKFYAEDKKIAEDAWNAALLGIFPSLIITKPEEK
jgi:hypothetical protein